jgi:hypothetical protein
MKPPLVRLADIPRLNFVLGLPKRLPQPKGRTVRPVRGSMNGTERRYAQHLEHRVRKGEVAAFWFEPVKFRLADKTWFTVDFMVMLAEGQIELHECKGGWVEDDAAVKMKVQSEAYWIFPVKLVREKPRGCFLITEIGR